MSTDSASAERAAAAAAQEYPDRTGWKPDNPYLAVFRPFIPSSAHLRELTPVPLIVGTLLGIVFGASSLYLVLKVGLTVSASIPVAVISITLFRALSKIRVIPSTVRYVLAFLSLILGAVVFFALQRLGVGQTWNIIASASVVAVSAAAPSVVGAGWGGSGFFGGAAGASNEARIREIGGRTVVFFFISPSAAFFSGCFLSISETLSTDGR